MQNVLSLIYLSRAKEPLDPSGMQALLASSRERNKAESITGILCTGRGCFLQVLEGPERAVIKLYAKILEDERHAELQLLGIRIANHRNFSQWAMAHLEGDGLEDLEYQKLLKEALVAEDPAKTARTLKGALEKLRSA